MRSEVVHARGLAERGSDAGRSRVLWLKVLVLLVAARSLVPGAITFWHQVHVFRQQGATEVALAHEASTVLGFGVLGSSLLVIATRHGRQKVPGMVVTYLAVMVYSLGRTGLVSGFSASQAFGLVEVGLVAIAVIVLEPRTSDLRLLGWVGVSLAAYSVAFAVLRPRAAMMPIEMVGKANFGGGVLAGPMSHSNTLGVFLALCFPFVLLIEKRRSRLLGVSMVLVTLLWSASRTSLVAVVVAVVLAMTLKALGTASVRRALAAIVVVVAGTLVAAVPLSVTSSAAFTNRGGVWVSGLHAWENAGSPLLGLGPYWTLLARTRGTDTVATSAHNLFVQWLVSGGPVLLIAGAILLYGLARKSYAVVTSNGVPVGLMFTISFLVISVTEFVFVQSAGSELFPVVGLAMLMVIVVGARTAEEAGAERDAQSEGTRGTALRAR